jgi:hypothetical protein
MNVGGTVCARVVCVRIVIIDIVVFCCFTGHQAIHLRQPLVMSGGGGGDWSLDSGAGAVMAPPE